MNIKIEYEPTTKELAKASSLFAEKKPFFLFTIGFINIFTGIFFVIFIISLIWLRYLQPQQWLALLICTLWLFGRRPFNEWILYQKMKNSIAIGKLLTIEVSRNGVVWSGKGLRQGHMTWDQIKYVLEAKNGFVLPNAFNKFLWLPFRGFQSPQDIEELKKLIVEMKIVYRVFPKWEC